MRALLKTIYLNIREALLRAVGLFMPGSVVSLAGFNPKKILFIRVDRLGDMTLTTPAFRVIKDRYPGAELCVLAAPAAGALIAADPRVDKIMIWGKGLRQRLRIILEVRRRGFDIAIDPLNGYELETALLAFLSGAGMRLGYESYGRGIFFNIRSGPPPGRVHFAEEAPYLLKMLGLINIPITPELFVSDEAAAAADKIFMESGYSDKDFVVALHPGGVYSSKRWPPERFLEIAVWLARNYKAKFLLIGNEEERALVDYLVSGLPPGAGAMAAINLRPDILCALMRKSRFFIGNNSGPLHMAAALGIPGVSTIGPADPVKWSPLGPEQVVLRAGLACSPCNMGACKSHECMRNITVEMMMGSVKSLLAKQGTAEKELNDET